MNIEIIILIFSFLALLIVNVPIAFCIGISTTLLLIIGAGFTPAVSTVAQQIATGFDSFTLLAIPFFILSGIDLRSIRIFRLLRVFRILKLFRFNDSIITMKKAFLNIKNELLLFTFLMMIVLYVASVGIYFFEKDAQPEQFQSIFHAMWWAICTLTTVGYGDI